MNPEKLVQQFQISDQIISIKAFGSGHINDTFRIQTASATAPDYLLQRINHLVFPDVGPMMNNIWQVTEHLKKQTHSPYTSLTIISTKDNQLFYLDAEGNYWRIYIFMEDLVAYDIVETTEQIYEGGKAFGFFLKDLSDFPAHELFPTLPNFHHVPRRLDNLQKAVVADSQGRLLQTQALVDYALSIADEMCTIQQLADQTKIPLRVTHNDTKFNNVLLDQNGHGRCVIDLDTIMPGYVHFDFGDGVRTCVSTAPEDETDLTLIQVELDRFEAYAAGYLEPTRDILTDLEIQYLPLSGAMLSYLMGIRFLTDYLMGDVYYKIHFHEHNLQRSSAQLELTRKLLERMADMERICRIA